MGRWSDPVSGSTSPRDDLDARRHEEVVDLVARAVGAATSCPRTARRQPDGVMASIVQPHMFMSPRNTAAPVGRRQAAPQGAGLEDGAELEVAEVGADDREVRAVDVDLRLQQQPRSTGRRAAAAARSSGGCGWACGRAARGTSRRCRARGRGRPGSTRLRLGLDVGPRHRHGDDVHLRGPPRPRRAAPTPPSGAHVSCSTMTSASKGDARRRRRRTVGQPSCRRPRPQCTLKRRHGQLGHAGQACPWQRRRSHAGSSARSSSTGKSCSSGSGSACSSAQVTE